MTNKLAKDCKEIFERKEGFQFEESENKLSIIKDMRNETKVEVAGVNLLDFVASQDEIKELFIPTNQEMLENFAKNLLEYSESLLTAIRDKTADQTELAQAGINCLNKHKEKLNFLLNSNS